MKIKDKILNCFAIAFISLLFLFAFTWIIFDFQSSANSLKDTWTIVSSLFGGIATLTAAYIASLLFNDWRVEKQFELNKEYLDRLFSLIFDIKNNISSQSHQIAHIYNRFTDSDIYSFLILEAVNFHKLSQDDITAYYYSEIISKLIPDCNIQTKYSNFRKSLCYLCFINEEVSQLYADILSNNSQTSPFQIYEANEHKLNETQLSKYKLLIKKVSKKSPVKSNNINENLSYSELIKHFEKSYDELFDEILKHITPRIKNPR